MNLFPCLLLAFIYKVSATNINGKDYKILKDKRALLNVTLTARSHSAIECATKCERSSECTHANYKNSNCEFLKYEPPYAEIVVGDDGGSKYICKFS